MLKLRQSRLEILLQELNDAFDFQVASGQDGDSAALRTNMAASRSVLNLLCRRGGPSLTKSEIIRKVVSDLKSFQLVLTTVIRLTCF